MCEPDGRRSGRALNKRTQEICIAPNESRPTTLPEANRAEGNVGGAARRSAAEPRAPPILSY